MPAVDAGRPGAPIVVYQCSMLDCPRLFVDVIPMCYEGRAPKCRENVLSKNPERWVECYSNGVKKYVTYDDQDGELWSVLKPGGEACYTLEVTSDDKSDRSIFKSPTGQELGRLVEDDEGYELFTCAENGKVFDVTEIFCPGLGPGGACDEDPTCR